MLDYIYSIIDILAQIQEAQTEKNDGIREHLDFVQTDKRFDLLSRK